MLAVNTQKTGDIVPVPKSGSQITGVEILIKTRHKL